MRSMERRVNPFEGWRLAAFGLLLCACGEEGSPAPIGGGTGAPAIHTPSSGSGGSTSGPGPTTSSGAGVTAPNMMLPNGTAGMSMSTAGASGAQSPIPAAGVSYHKDIRPLIEARCLGCHVDGASGPFPLDTWESVNNFKGPVVQAVMTRKMPPWLADDTNCTPVRHDQRLTDAQLALFAAWQSAGFPQGDPGHYAPLAEAPAPDIGEPTVIIKATRPHQLSPGEEYYACLQTDADISEDTWVTAMDIVPENSQYVHHAIVSVGGGLCSALGTVAENIYSYRPGSRTLVFEKGDALLLPAGSVIAIQFHYNTKFAMRGQTLPSDQSAYRLWTLPKGQLPERVITRMPLHDLSINIPVNAVGQEEGGSATVGSEYARAGAEIIGVSPHMHYLGQTFKGTLRTSDGMTHCLVDIPDWDQDWQLDYFFEPSAYIPVARGARVTQTCVFNNRAEDQGFDPDGNQFTPMWTTWGEDTRNEMCLGYFWFRYPMNGAD